MYFTFNGVHSSKYNLFIVNDNDLVIENGVDESSEFITAMFQEGNYYTGTQKTQKTFKRKCAAEGLTLSQYKAMMKWLSAGTTGFLVFDNNPYWGWSVVLSEVGDATIADRSQGLIVEFELTWKTAGSYLARNYYPAYSSLDEALITNISELTCTCNGKYNTSMICNEYGIPVIYYECDESTNEDETITCFTNNLYCIQSVNNMHQYINFTYVGDAEADSTELQLSHNGDIYVDLKTQEVNSDFVVEFLGESGLVLADNNLIESVPELLNYHYQLHGLLQLPSESPVELTSVEVSGSQLILNKNEIDDLLLNGYNYICFTKLIDNASAEYSTSEWNSNTYPHKYETYLFFIDDSNLIARLEDTIETDADYSGFITDLNSSYTATSEQNINSMFSNVLTDGNTIKENSTLFITYHHDWFDDERINWSDFKCYMGKSNFVTIQCNGAKFSQNDNIKSQQTSVTVVSFNNL